MFGRYYLLLLKAQLKRVETWAAVGLIVILVAVFSAITLPSSDNLVIGIYCEDADEAEGFIRVLHGAKSIYDFEQIDSLEELKAGVESGALECGFELKEDYKETFEAGSQSDVMTYYCSTLSTKGEAAKESVYLALLKIQNGIYLRQNAGELYKEPSEELLQELDAMMEDYLSGDELFSIQEEYVAGTDETRTQTLTEKGNAKPVLGTIALILFALVFLTVGDARGKEKRGYAILLRRGERMEFAFARTLAAATIPGILGFAVMIAAGEKRWGNWTFLHGLALFGLLLALIVYGFLFCYGVSALLRKDGAYFSAFIVMLLVTAVLCPIYLDLSLYAPVLKYFRWLLPVGLFLI